MLVVGRLEALGVRVVDMINNRGGAKEEDYWFTPKKVLFYCIIVGLISGTLSIFINSLILLSMAAFVFTSITGWYMFAEKFHRWQEEREKKKKRSE
jgi:hypothetical protein